MKTPNSILLLFIIPFFLFCSNPTDGNNDELDLGKTDFEISDWTEATHSNDVDPNYEIVFSDDKVLRIEITISEQNWTYMQADLTENIGDASGPDAVAAIDFTPVWVPATLTFEGTEWYKVGVRYKGNSSLETAYNSDTEKYAFKLDFDEFEDEFPSIDNQRFYGFKQLNLSNNTFDGSLMREKVAGDLFRDFGVVSARTTFCTLYLDRGNGSNFVGVYALVEEVDDSVPDSQFPDNDGNLYKPDGDAASFASGTFNEEEMDLKTNEDEADYSDIKALYDLLNRDTRTSNESEWKTDLEEIFNVDNYLKYLAVNNVIQNWDTYGIMTHNYFLYNDEGKLTWIPWDNNEAFQEGKMDGALSLGMDEVTSDWPIIRYIIDIEEYESKYRNYVKEFSEGIFTSERMNSLLSTYETLIGEYASLENADFSTEVDNLKAFIETRNSVVAGFTN